MVQPLLEIARIPQRMTGSSFLARVISSVTMTMETSSGKEEQENERGRSRRKRGKKGPMGELVFELTWFTPLQTDHVSATQRRGARAHPVLRGSLFRGPLRSRPQKSSTLCETLRSQRAERSHTCSFDPFRSSFGSLDRRATRPARRRLSLLPKPRRRPCRRQTRRRAVEKSCRNAGFGVTVACETGSRTESTYSDEWVH